MNKIEQVTGPTIELRLELYQPRAKRKGKGFDSVLKEAEGKSVEELRKIIGGTNPGFSGTSDVLYNH